MAARRLVIIMIVLLIASSIAAALAPQPPRDQQQETTPATPPPAPEALEPAAAARGELVRARVVGGDEPARVRARAGDQLQLTVIWDEVATLEIAGIGETADVGPSSPAHFDVLLNDPGRYRVVPLDDPERTLATINVRPRTPGG
jgi:hypothetical protein